jgi:hypothetical protein
MCVPTYALITFELCLNIDIGQCPLCNYLRITNVYLAHTLKAIQLWKLNFHPE